MNTKNSKQIKEDGVAATDNQTISTDYLEKIWNKVEREREYERVWGNEIWSSFEPEWMGETECGFCFVSESVIERERERMMSCT